MVRHPQKGSPLTSNNSLCIHTRLSVACRDKSILSLVGYLNFRAFSFDSYRWMPIGESVIQCHVDEKWAEMRVEKVLHNCVLEARVDEHGGDECFDHVR